MSLYEELGVKRYINACATLTAFGGSIMPQRVLNAMQEASRSYVSIAEFHRKAGDLIAKLTHNEAAFIPNGAASGIMLCTAIAITAGDKEKLAKLPDSTGMENEVVVFGPGRVGYDFAIKQAGGKVVEYGSREGTSVADLEAAITDKTAAIFVFHFEHNMVGQLPLAEVSKVAKKHGLYLFVDAAAQLPRKENLWKLTGQGADAAIFSGGKGLRGPQSSGLIVGTRKLVDLVASIASPNSGIGRPMKVGKEEIAGLTEAVRLFMETDEEATLARYEQMTQQVLDAFAGVAGVTATRDFPSEAGQPMPRAKLAIAQEVYKATAAEMNDQLKQLDPAIFVAEMRNAFYLNPQTLEDGELEIVIAEIKKVLAKNKK